MPDFEDIEIEIQDADIELVDAGTAELLDHHRRVAPGLDLRHEVLAVQHRETVLDLQMELRMPVREGKAAGREVVQQHAPESLEVAA